MAMKLPGPFTTYEHTTVPQVSCYKFRHALQVVKVLLHAGLLCACSVPLVFNLQYGRRSCGPHQGISMLVALGAAVSRAPRCMLTLHHSCTQEGHAHGAIVVAVASAVGLAVCCNAQVQQHGWMR